ncbi:hypothetical protein KCP69_03785 [Salmonella enterica subsp. enterica]|nr:hypothetical protein KCP69_03785 [Salmonella enterica subsp. enterica]
MLIAVADADLPEDRQRRGDRGRLTMIWTFEVADGLDGASGRRRAAVDTTVVCVRCGWLVWFAVGG